WPCRHYPGGWTVRARALLDEYTRLRTERRLSSRPDDPKDSFAPLRQYLAACVADPKSLTGRDVGRIRLILARYVAKRGLPDSPCCREHREQQARQVGGPTLRAIAHVVILRLEAYPANGGLDDLGPVVRPITEDEAQQFRIPVATSVPPALQRKIERSRY